MKAFKKIVLLGSLACFLFVFFAPVTSAQTLSDEIKRHNRDLADSAGYGAVEEDPRIIAANSIRIFLTFLGIIFVLYTIYGGWLILNSRGNTEHVEHGKKIIRNGVIGVVVILSSYGLATYAAHLIRNAQADPFKSEDFRSFIEEDLEDVHNRDRLDQDMVPFRPRALENFQGSDDLPGARN